MADNYKSLSHFIGGIYGGEFHVPAGMKFRSHKHCYDHMSVLCSGIAAVEVDGTKNTYVGPAVIEIKAKAQHELTAVTDVVWLCLHAVDPADSAYLEEDAEAMRQALVEAD